MKAYALMKTKKYGECEAIINSGDWPLKQKDPYCVFYLSLIFTALSHFAKALRVLEGEKECIPVLYPNDVDLGEGLFFAYVRENKILK